MNRVRHFLFYLCITALWLFVILAALEVWPRLQWFLVENYNPYLISRNQQTPWPISDMKENASCSFPLDTDMQGRYRGRGKSTVPLPEVTPEQEMARRIPSFFEYEAPERYLFANVFGLHVFLLRSDGVLTASYSVNDYAGTDMLSAYVEEADVQPILNAANQQSDWNGGICFVKRSTETLPDSFGYCLVLPPGVKPQQGKPEEVWLMFRRPEATADIPRDSLWELRFMTYKKHVTRQDRISVLGITEDYYINNYGFRDRDIIVPKPEGVFRILCIGASTTEEGITNDLTYPAILETMINQHFEGNSVDVINCGISGMNAMKYRMRFPDYLALSPDMLLIYEATNDICHQLLPRLVNEATPRQQYLRRSRFVTEHFNYLLLPTDDGIREAIVKYIMPNVRYILQESGKRGIKTALCSFAAPTLDNLSAKEHAYYNYLTMKEWGGSYVTFDSYLRILDLYNEELRKLCEEEGSLYIAVAEKLQGGAALFGDICHLRNAGIQRKTKIIADTLIPYLETVIVSQ